MALGVPVFKHLSVCEKPVHLYSLVRLCVCLNSPKIQVNKLGQSYMDSAVFSIILPKGNSFVDFHLDYLDDTQFPPKIGSALRRKNLLLGSKFFPLRVDPILEERQK